MEKKWYHQWWVYVLVGLIFFLLGYIIFREKDRITEREVYENKIEIIKVKMEVLDSLYNIAVAEKEIAKALRGKIDITKDIRKLKELITELEKVKTEPVKSNPSMLHLKEFIETEFK